MATPKTPVLQPCPVCKGDCVQHLTIIEFGKPDEVVDIPCVWCEGKGAVNEVQMLTYLHYTQMWCECGNPSGKTVFFNDGEHPELHKHHYRCFDCKKVVQIG